MSTQQRAGILAGVALTVLAGLGGFAAFRSRLPPPVATSPSPPRSPSQLRPAPNFPIVLYQGSQELGKDRMSLAEIWKTGKPIVLNFWAAECLPCREELPNFQDLYRSVAKGKWTMLAIDIGPYVGLGSREEGKGLLHDLKITFPAGTTYEEDTIYVYRIIGIPTTVFITPDGKIFKLHPGLLSRAEMTAFIQDLLQASGIH